MNCPASADPAREGSQPPEPTAAEVEAGRYLRYDEIADKDPGASQLADSSLEDAGVTDAGFLQWVIDKGKPDVNLPATDRKLIDLRRYVDALEQLIDALQGKLAEGDLRALGETGAPLGRTLEQMTVAELATAQHRLTEEFGRRVEAASRLLDLGRPPQQRG